jgi:hypothetical protein
LGIGPATTDEADIERHRRLNAALDRNYHPHRWDHLKAAHKKSGKTPGGG